MNKINPYISIIVPFFNAEKYLHRCIDSILVQTLDKIEIILVNDGSTDSSARIAESYANADNRVIVIDKSNGGVSDSRNAGMAIAKGEYIGFVDADDWIKPEMYEKLYSSALKNNSDMVMGGHFRAEDNGGISEYPNLPHTEVYRDNELKSIIVTQMVGRQPYEENEMGIEPCVWRNIYKSEIIKRNNIFFKSERVYISEDILFNIDFIMFSHCISIVSDPLYYYYCNSASLTQIYRNDRFEKECVLNDYIIEKLNEIGLFEICRQRVYRTFLARTRNCIVSEAKYNKGATVSKRIVNIKSIVNNDSVVKCINEYPINDYRITLRIIAYCIKYKLAFFLFILTSFRKRR